MIQRLGISQMSTSNVCSVKGAKFLWEGRGAAPRQILPIWESSDIKSPRILGSLASIRTFQWKFGYGCVIGS